MLRNYLCMKILPARPGGRCIAAVRRIANLNAAGNQAGEGHQITWNDNDSAVARIVG